MADKILRPSQDPKQEDPKSASDESPDKDIDALRREVRFALTYSKGILRSHLPNSWVSRIFNNLKLYLPGKIGKRQYAMFEEIGAIDTLLGDEKSAYSEFARTKTVRQFYEDIANVVAECNTDMKRVDELLERKSHVQFFEDDAEGREKGPIREEFQDEQKELFKLLRPVYEKLRLIGYSHYDITGMELPEDTNSPGLKGKY